MDHQLTCGVDEGDWSSSEAGAVRAHTVGRGRQRAASAVALLGLVAVLALLGDPLQLRGQSRGASWDEGILLVENGTLRGSKPETINRSDVPVVINGWTYRPGLKCFSEHGGAELTFAGHDADNLTVKDCQHACLHVAGCEGVMVVRGWNPGPCHLRATLQLDKCLDHSVWDLWTAPSSDPCKKSNRVDLAEDDELGGAVDAEEDGLEEFEGDENPEQEDPCGADDDSVDRYLSTPATAGAKRTSSPKMPGDGTSASLDGPGRAVNVFADIADQLSLQKDWEVVFDDGAEVWSDKDSVNSEVTDVLPKCSVFPGLTEASYGAPDLFNWVKRLDAPGYVRIVGPASSVEEDSLLLQEQQVRFEAIPNGTCETHGLWPIATLRLCNAAARKLAFANAPDATLTTEGDFDGVPEAGCYYHRQSARLLLQRGIAAAMRRTTDGATMGDNVSLLCSAIETCYPTTTTTTTTVTKTTTRTTTVTKTTTTATTTSTTSTTTSWGWPSLFCFAVVTPWGYEPSLVAKQYERGAGIFNCDDYAVLSGGEGVQVGPLEVLHIPDTDGGAGMGDLSNPSVTTNSFLNTFIFINAWKVVVEQTNAMALDWHAKVDPDAVFFPERLRWHLEQHTHEEGPERVFFMNCNRRFGDSDPEWSKLFGSLEIFSHGAVQTYAEQKDRCLNELNWQGWGEDYFMSHCMDHLGVGRVEDFYMLADNRCNGAPCTDTSKVSYHDFKDEGGWFWCWESSLGEEGVKEYDDRVAAREKNKESSAEKNESAE